MLISARDAPELWRPVQYSMLQNTSAAIPIKVRFKLLTDFADDAEAALLAERDIMQRKAAMGSMNAADLRNLREQLRLDT